jgi:hypothetical protein
MAIKNLGKVVPEKGVDYFTEEDIRSLNIPKSTSDLTNDSLYATESYVKNQIANAQLGGESCEVDLSGYATKDELPTKTSQLINDSGFITSIPSEYVTESELNEKKYLTSVPSTYKTKTENDELYQPKGNYITSYTESDPTVPSHVKAITQEDINKWNNNSSGGGLSTNASNLIVTLFRASLFNSDQTANITALEEELLGNSGTDVTKYTIKNILTNIVTSNAIGLIVENASYNAILTASDGYAIESVTVIMGDNDITSSAYSNGVINISKVTGNITITATATQTETGGDTSEVTLPTNGLYGYFDLRNPQAIVGSYEVSVAPVQGNGVGTAYLNTTSKDSSFNEYGTVGNTNLWLCDEKGYGSESKAKDLGTEFSICVKHYGGIVNIGNHTGPSNLGTEYGRLNPKYNKTSGSASVPSVSISGSHATDEYHNFDMVVNGENIKFYLDGELKHSYNGSDYDDFVSWVSKNIISIWYGSGQVTAVAVYTKALNDVEIIEVDEYFKTLEVNK